MDIDWQKQIEVDFGEMGYSLEELYQAFKERLKEEGFPYTIKKVNPCQVSFDQRK